MPILPSPQPPAGTALAILEEVTSGESRQDVATKLVKLFLGQGLAVPLLDYLTTGELARTSKCQGWGAPPAPLQPGNWVARVPPGLHGEKSGATKGQERKVPRVPGVRNSRGGWGIIPSCLSTASVLFQRTPTPSSAPTRWPPRPWSNS